MDELYNTTFLAATIAPLRNFTPFILRNYFANYVGPTGQSKIAFDVEDEILGVAPFVYPLVAGKPMRERGYTTDEFKPAYVKPFTALDPERPLNRMIGERLEGDMTPQEREEARIAMTFRDQVITINRRFELMGIEAIVTGKVTVSGEGYDEPVVVDFGRDSELTDSLTGSNQWGESGVSPVTAVEDKLQDIAEKSGAYPDIVTMDKSAFRLYRADPLYKDMINTDYRGSTAELETALTGDLQQGVLIGRIGANGPELWVYNGVYKDEAGSIQKYLPEYSVLFGSRNPEASGTRYFGDVIDPDAGYAHTEFRDPETGLILPYMAKTWTQKNPGQRYVMTQAAPLPVPTRKNATAYMKVRAA